MSGKEALEGVEASESPEARNSNWNRSGGRCGGWRRSGRGGSRRIGVGLLHPCLLTHHDRSPNNRVDLAEVRGVESDELEAEVEVQPRDVEALLHEGVLDVAVGFAVVLLG